MFSNVVYEITYETGNKNLAVIAVNCTCGFLSLNICS